MTDTEPSGNHGEEWGENRADIKYIKLAIDEIKPLILIVASHTEQIKQLRWLVGAIVVTLLTLVVKAAF